MDFKIGDATFPVRNYDTITEVVDDILGQNTRPKHVRAVLKSIQDTRSVEVMTYDCRTGMVDLKNATPKGHLRLSQQIFILGLDGVGNLSRKADKALRKAFVAATGMTTIFDVDGDLNKRLGVHSVPIQADKLVKVNGPKVSIKVMAKSRWRLWHLKLPKGFPPGDILVAFPYAVRFTIYALYDCKRRRPITAADPRYWTGLRERPLTPHDPVARADVRGELEAQKRRLESFIEDIELVLQEFKLAESEDPEDEELRSERLERERLLKEQKARLKEIAEQMARLRGD